MSHEEFHVTVAGDPIRWPALCRRIGIKPLWIELNTFERQLMCASNKDPRIQWAGSTMLEYFQRAGYQIVRVKHEAQVPYDTRVNFYEHQPLSLQIEDPPQPFLNKITDPVYYECHVKIDGLFNPKMRMASRDLYREDRWYVTRRRAMPFDPKWFRNMIQSSLEVSRWPAEIRAIEYEACVSDSYPELDAAWTKTECE